MPNLPDYPFDDSTRAAIELACERSRAQGSATTTGVLLASLIDCSPAMDWQRIWLETGEQRDTLASADDGADRDRAVGPGALTLSAEEALDLAEDVRKRYDFNDISIPILSLAIVSHRPNGAVATLTMSGTSREQLIAAVQLDIVGSDLEGFNSLLDSTRASADEDRQRPADSDPHVELFPPSQPNILREALGNALSQARIRVVTLTAASVSVLGWAVMGGGLLLWTLPYLAIGALSALKRRVPRGARPVDYYQAKLEWFTGIHGIRCPEIRLNVRADPRSMQVFVRGTSSRPVVLITPRTLAAWRADHQIYIAQILHELGHVRLNDMLAYYRGVATLMVAALLFAVQLAWLTWNVALTGVVLLTLALVNLRSFARLREYLADDFANSSTGGRARHIIRSGVSVDAGPFSATVPVNLFETRSRGF